MEKMHPRKNIKVNVCRGFFPPLHFSFLTFLRMTFFPYLTKSSFPFALRALKDVIFETVSAFTTAFFSFIQNTQGTFKFRYQF